MGLVLRPCQLVTYGVGELSLFSGPFLLSWATKSLFAKPGFIKTNPPHCSHTPTKGLSRRAF